MFEFSRLPDRVRHAFAPTVLAVALIAAILIGSSPQSASAYPSPGAVTLGTASSFAVLGGSAVTNTGPTIVNGDLGVSPGTSITGFPPGIVNGVQHSADAVALQAQTDTTAAYNDLASRAPDQDLTGTDLGGLILSPGVYNFDSSAGLTGSLTLDAGGDSSAIFIFQIGSALTTASGSQVVLTNGAQACNVYWQIGESATLGTNSTFVGNVLALASITMNTGSNVYGRVLARTGAATLDSNTVTPTCAAAIPAPLAVDKTASPASRVAPGGLFTFTVTVTNTGTSDVTLTSLLDDVHGDLNGQGSCSTGGTIAAGDSYACAFTATFTGAPGDSETDTITAIATDAADTPVAGADSATVTISGPSITVVKTANPTSRPEPGGQFTFKVRVDNTGPTAVTLTSLVDDIYGNLNGVGSCATGGTIAVGASYLCSFTRTFTGVAGDSQTDTVDALVTDANGNTATDSDDATVRITPVGVFEICKAANNANGAVTGTYTFIFSGRTVNVPVGSCTGPLTVPVGNLTVREVAKPGVRISACTTRPTDRLVKCDPADSSAVIRIVAGGVANETILTITNRLVGSGGPTGAIKVCKIAGPGVGLGTNFSFSVGGKPLTVAAGPASQGGYCKIVYGFAQGTDVVVTEAARAGTHVSAITVQPANRGVSSNNANRTATVTVGSGTTVVSFTNRT